MWITPILDHRGRFDWTTCPCILHFGCMGIIVTPPGRRNRQAETASQSAQRLRGLGMPETRGKNARGQNVRNEHAVPAISETTSISEISAAAETSTAIATTEQSPEPAKPTLRDLAGVKLPTNRLNRTGPNATVHDSSSNQSTRSSPYSPCRARSAQA